MKQFKTMPNIMSDDQITDYNSEINCYDLCRILFDSSDDNKIKVKDHSHITGKYCGAACKQCNFKLRLTTKLPVILHNLRGNDSHLLMQKQFNKKINIIPNNMKTCHVEIHVVFNRIEMSIH